MHFGTQYCQYKLKRYIGSVRWFFDILEQSFGGMAEWTIAAVLKTVGPKGSVGSNPTPSAKKEKHQG